MRTKTHHRISALLAGVLACGVTLLLHGAEPAGSTVTNQSGTAQGQELKPLVWSYDLSYGLAVASASYSPVLVLFSSDYCSWCRRLKETMDYPELNPVLGQFALVELDVMQNEAIASQYMVRSLPTLVFLASDGRVKLSVAGYQNALGLRELLLSVLNPSAAQKVDSASKVLSFVKASEPVADEDWVDVVLGTSDPVLGAAIKEALLKRADFNPSNMVPLLVDERIAVRMGALDLLEEFSGETFGFDVWQGGASTNSTPALELWQQWSANPENTAAGIFYVSLEPDQIKNYFRDLMGSGHARSLRAMRLLLAAGPSVVRDVDAYIAQNPDLPAGSIRKLRELKYALILSNQGIGSGMETAHCLVFGNMDMTMQALEKLSTYPRGAALIYRDFLSDPEPVVRESAADGLLKVMRAGALPVIEERLKQERDNDCVFAMLKGVGAIKSQSAVELLMQYCDAAYEDHAVIAFEGLANQKPLKSDAVEAAMRKGLKDQRWRVRVEALKAVAAFSYAELLDEAEPLLNDPDDYVRYTAVISLARIGKPETLKKFNQLFMESPEDRLAVVEAYVAMELPLPQEFIATLIESKPDEILQIVNIMRERGASALMLVNRLLLHADADVANAALACIAEVGAAASEYRGELVDALRNGGAERRRIVLQHIKWRVLDDDPYLKKLALQSNDIGSREEQAPVAPKAASMAGEALEQFRQALAAKSQGEPGSAAVEPEKPKKRSSVLGAFAQVLNKAQPDKESAVVDVKLLKQASVEELVEAVATIIKDEESELRFPAALSLMKFGYAPALPVILQNIEGATEQERDGIAEALAQFKSKGPEIKALTTTLLRDSSSEVRSSAIQALSESGNQELITLLFEEALKPDAVLEAAEMAFFRRSSPYGNRSGGTISSTQMRKYAQEFLEESRSVDSQILGLILLGSSSDSESVDLVETYLKSPENLVRRAAARSLSQMDSGRFNQQADAIASDSSDKVRAVVLAAWDGSYSWQNLFSKSAEGRSHYGYYPRSSASLSAQQIDVLKKLSQDESPAIRVNAYFCMIGNKVPFNLMELGSVMDQLPDQEAAVRRLSTLYKEYRVEELGAPFKALLPYVKVAENLDEDDWKKIEKHFGPLEEKESLAEFIEYKSRLVKGATSEIYPADEMYSPARTNALAASGISSNQLQLVFFSNVGCEECIKIKRTLTHLQNTVAGLHVVTHDILTVAGFQMNEALCERFGVPDSRRAATPAVFAEAGVLIKGEISDAALAELVRASAGLAPRRLEMNQAEMQRAQVAVEHKKSNIKLWLIILFGLLDGINPCAFATLIFLISYLQVARRNIRQIAVIGVAFIAAVFLTYFALGLGLRRLIGELKLLQYGGMIFNWAVISFAVVLCALNVRDAIICARGRMDKMVLQLPGVLKKQIHATIQVGAKHRMFVVAAFVTGVIVSLLELACTGAIYVPVLHMLSDPGSRTIAVLYLALYNFMFILPLIIVFALVCKGLTSEHLIKWMRDNVVKVKIMTAVLFAVLAIVLLFDNQIKELIPLLDINTSEKESQR
ncbi:MAG: HEAT repeat domain-containing protein [Kiritimatiellae bacterium]|nr:HEAT repeat domain-containing protein [Kiritimatiellia bacterium]